jgi:hypothetical protein
MYSIDDRDRVVELRGLPQSSVGAPCPVVVASEHELIVTYLVESTPPGWDAPSVRMVGTDTADAPAAVVRFQGSRATMFGPPNDEAGNGHPLAERGLRPYGAFEVIDSSWVRQLERMNSMHPGHRPERYNSYRHFVLAFHDSTFECVAKGYVSRLASGPLNKLAAEAAASLR